MNSNSSKHIVHCYSRACSLPLGHESLHRDGHNGARYSEPPTPRCSEHPAYEADYCPVCGTARVIGGR